MAFLVFDWVNGMVDEHRGSKDGDVCVVEVKKMEVRHRSKRLHLGSNITSLEFHPSERLVQLNIYLLDVDIYNSDIIFFFILFLSNIKSWFEFYYCDLISMLVCLNVHMLALKFTAIVLIIIYICAGLF